MVSSAVRPAGDRTGSAATARRAGSRRRCGRAPAGCGTPRGHRWRQGVPHRARRRHRRARAGWSGPGRRVRSTAVVIASARSGRLTSMVATTAVGGIGSEAPRRAWSRSAIALARLEGTAGADQSCGEPKSKSASRELRGPVDARPRGRLAPASAADRGDERPGRDSPGARRAGTSRRGSAMRDGDRRRLDSRPRGRQRRRRVADQVVVAGVGRPPGRSVGHPVRRWLRRVIGVGRHWRPRPDRRLRALYAASASA